MSATRAERTPLRISVAVVTAALVVVDLLLRHTSTQKVLGAVLLVVLGLITVTDLEERRIPNRVVVPAAVVAVIIGAVMHPAGLPAQIVAGVATAAFLLLFAVVSGGGLGMGDVKLGLVLGLFLGAQVIVALVIGVLASACFAVGVIVVRGFEAGRRTWIPMGPFLALGGAVAVLAGPALGPHWA